MMTTLTARPEAITFDPQQSALIVVDMQNAYATPGGYLEPISIGLYSRR